MTSQHTFNVKYAYVNFALGLKVLIERQNTKDVINVGIMRVLSLSF